MIEYKLHVRPESDTVNHRQHPDTHRPWGQWSEDETLHIIGVYTNPFRWHTRRNLFNDFIRHMRGTANVALHVVEVAFGDRPFEVTGEHPNDVQVRTDATLWHKENAINLAVRAFPTTWKYGGYVDGDFTFNRHDWALEAIHMLQHHAFVQLFSSYTDVTGETATSYEGHRPYRVNSSFGWNYLHQNEFLEHRKHKPLPGQDCYYEALQPSATFPFGYAPGATGGAWAWRRPAFDQVGGMLDSHVVGGADWDMAFALIGELETGRGKRGERNALSSSDGYYKAAAIWQEKAKALNKNIGCIDNFAVHHFHGSKNRRGYAQRWDILRKHNFDPWTDLTLDWQRAYRWAGNKPALEADVYKYFTSRSEDSTELLGERSLV